MIKKFTVTSILVLVTCLTGFNVFSQCAATAYNEGAVAVGCNGFGASVNISSTAFRTFNVTNGVLYSISSCGSPWDSQVTVKDNSNNNKAYNDDNGPSCSGTAASVDWTADYTGTARAFVHRYNCGSVWPGTSAILQVRQNSTVTNTTNNATICTSQTKALTYTVSSGTGVPTWSVIAGAGTIAGTTFTPSAAGSVTVRATLGVCVSDVTFVVSAPTGNPAVFGNGAWNVYAYNAGDAGGGSGAWTNNYSGFYTENNLGFVTTSRWANSPSEANAASGSAYSGCSVNADNHSWSAKRTNIPCGVYQLQVQHDDIGQIFINGTNVYNNAACCTTTNAGTFVIVPSDNVEYRVSEGGGGSDGTIAFNNAFTALNAGSITYGGSLNGCINFDPPAFGNGGDASGGASAAITSGSSTYQWQVNSGNISGANATTYDAPAIAGPGTYVYRRIVTDRCGNTAISNTYTITIAANNTVGAASSSPNVCINTAITAVTHATTGATGIGAASGLPAGVTAVWASNTITISGTPSVGGTFNYSIPLTGGCGSANATGTITVRANNTVGAASSSPSICIGTAISSVTHSTTGATGIGVASGLPAGVTASWAANTITISGTPSASGTFNYSIPLTGGCGSASATGTITVNANNTVGAASSSPSGCIGTAISSITHSTTGATGIGVASGLPAGVTASWAANTITISGTPSASGTFNYTIPLTGGCGSANATGTITVTAGNTVGVASSSPNVCINTAITAVTHATTGATGIGAASGLPAGVTAVWASNTITISGTPSVGGTFNYSIPLTGGCGSANATGTITVRVNNTVGAASSSPSVCIGTSISSVTHSTTGATGIGVASGLPAGVTASWAANTITISGTPSASGTFNYSIPLTGGCGSVNATGTITVSVNNTVGAASSSPSICIGTPIASVTHSTTGATGIGVASGLPAGVTALWAANTITIIGTPVVSGTFNYTIPLTGGCGSANATGTITVSAGNAVGVASSSPSICIGTAITSVTHTTIGATSIGVALGLPAGVTASWAANTITISGTPSVSGTFNYTIPLSGGCSLVNATGTITVNDRPTPSFASISPTANVCRGTEVTYTTQSGQSNYAWSILGTPGIDYDIVSGGTSGSNVARISWLAAGLGTVVSVNYQNGAGCSAISLANSSAVTLPPLAVSLSTNGQSATCRVNGSHDISFVNGTDLVLSLRSGASIDLGDVTATSYVGATGTMQACGTSASEPQFMAAYMGRRWVVQAPSAPASPLVEATLPFTSGELSSLATTSNIVTTANPFDDVNASNNGSDLILVKHTSATEDSDPTNNCGSGTTVAIMSPSVGTVLGNRFVRYTFTGFSEWYLHGASNVSPLPIVLTSFTAACESGQVKLDWVTATEINNEQFIIDRSADMLAWEEVVTLPGAGNSNQPLHYTAADLRPISGLSYYRLTQRDYNGTSETFAPISIICSADGEGNSMMVYPNPAEDIFTVSVTLQDACNDCNIEITDMNGKRIAMRNVSMNQGENAYTFDRALMNPGQYIIQLKSGNFMIKPVKLIVK